MDKGGAKAERGYPGPTGVMTAESSVYVYVPLVINEK